MTDGGRGGGGAGLGRYLDFVQNLNEKKKQQQKSTKHLVEWHMKDVST